MKPGTKIEIRGFDLSRQEIWYPAKIGRMPKADRPDNWWPITYPDGGQLLSHISSFRVVDNR